MNLALAIDAGRAAVVATVDVDAGATSLFLSRVGPDGVPAYVRGVAPATVVGPETVTVTDYEAPIGVPLTYTAQTTDDTGTGSPTVTADITVPSGGCDDTWLNDIARPANSQRVIIERLEELLFGTAQAVHWVINRRTPIVTSNIGHSPTLELNFLTETDAERERAKNALGNGPPVLLRTPPEYGLGNMYLAVSEWHEQRIVNSTIPDRRFVVAAVQVDRPDPSLWLPIPGMTYEVWRAWYATYSDLTATGKSYRYAQNDPAYEAPPALVPWPPADV